MVNWNDPTVLGVCNEIFKSISHVAIGAYLWEAFSSLGFEWSLVTRKRAFKWPMLLYFYCKWSLVAAFIGMLIALNVHSEINCQALYNFNQFAGNSALGASSTLLMLRSIAIWQRNRWVSASFIIVGLGLWGIQMHGVTTVRAHWNPLINSCSVDAVTGVYLSLVYLYTMFTDLIVLIVTLAGLSFSPGRSGLWRMLWDQGIMFFMIAFIANLIPAVMLLVNLNPVINIMFSIPAIAATATCACRCFVGLSEYARRGDDMSAALGTNANTNGWSHRIQGPSKLGSTVQFRRERHQMGDGPEDSPGGRNFRSGGGGGNAFGGPFEPKQTDTIDVILRSLSFSGPPGQRYIDRRYDDEQYGPDGGLDRRDYDDGYIGMDDVATPVKYERGSDDTLSFSPLDTSAAAIRHSRSAQPLSGGGATGPQPPMMAVRRGSVPIIAAPVVQESRRPSATTDIQHARLRSLRRPDDNV